MIDVGEKLYKKYKIKKRSDIKGFFENRDHTLFLYSKKKMYSIIIKANNCEYFRFAVSVKKSKGCAPIRNREKRIVREIFRRNKDCIFCGYDYFIIVNNVDKLAFEYRERCLLSIFNNKRRFTI